MLGFTFGVNILLPIGNVFRALLLVLNLVQVRCKNGQVTPIGSIYAFGAPILYLVLQVIALLAIIVWIEGDKALFRRGRAAMQNQDPEAAVGELNANVGNEGIHVDEENSDFLRAVQVSKSFKSNTAVQDVSFRLPGGDITALIGPNGAGKSTLVNLIQGELSLENGKIFLLGEDARTQSAKRHLGSQFSLGIKNVS